MDAKRWSQLSPLLDELLELDETLRVRRLQQLAVSHPDLAAELERLLAVEKQSDGFIAEPLLAHHDQLARQGDRVGDYQLLKLLGEGGMGQVWLAADMRHQGPLHVALKLLRPDLADPNLRARFLRERDTLARLSHARIPRLHDAGGEGGNQLYLALEYAPGESIVEHCQRNAASIRRCVDLFLQVCEALEHVHAQGIVHRDVKPSNILVDAYDQVRLLDFGIARHRDEPDEPVMDDETRAFTLHYAAPEQIRGEAVDTTADVYSLGVVLYELLTGQKPYRLRRQSDAEWERAVLRAEVTSPSVMLQRQVRGQHGARLARRAAHLRGDLDAIVLKALQKPADLRYGSVSALAADLRRWQHGEAASVRQAPPPRTWLRWWRRDPVQPPAGA